MVDGFKIEPFTEEDLARMQDYQKRTGERVIYTYQEKCEIYRLAEKERLIGAARGIGQSLFHRLNLDNADSFDSPDESWKNKQLKENFKAILQVIAEK